MDIDTKEATGVLIHVTGGPYMTLEAANQVVEMMTNQVSEDANVIMGARQDPSFGDTIKVMAIITGVGGDAINKVQLQPDKLGEALRLTRQSPNKNVNTGFARFDYQ